MTAKEFAKELRESGIEFNVDCCGAIRTERVKNQRLLCPITALCYHKLNQYFYTWDYQSAGQLLGLSFSVSNCIAKKADITHITDEEFFTALETGVCDEKGVSNAS